MFFAFSKSKPSLYIQFLVSEEIKCREKLIICLDKESSLIEAGDQGIKITKLYINYLKSYEIAYKSLENFNLSFIQKNSIGNNSIQRSLKGISEIAKCFEGANAGNYANKAYSLLYDSAISVFPGQVKDNEPYEYIYEAFFDYFEFLLIIKEFEKLNEEIIKTIEMVSPSLQEILQREHIKGKDFDVDNILSLYYRLLMCKICLEDEKGFVEYFRKASEIKFDSAQDTILEAIEKVYDACMKGDEKLFNRNITLLDSILRNSEIKELRSKMRKYQNHEPGNNNNDKNITANLAEIKNLKNKNAENNNNINIEMENIKSQMGNMNKKMNQNFEKLNNLSDFGTEIFKKGTFISDDLINKNNENVNNFQGKVSDRQRIYQIENDEDEENEENHVVILDNNKKVKGNEIAADDYL
jgi:hypothetical protein